MTTTRTIPLGFEVGTGKPVAIPLAHTFVTGQTQLSGKTTTLRAIVERSGCRALAFVTKRGEEFEGRRLAPYLPREGEQPIHWRLVETILASALGQRSLKYERLWIVNAAKGARSLADVRTNVDRLKAKAKGNTADVYMLIGEYLDLVLPEMRALASSDVLDLQPGLNVMDLAGIGPQLQALVIRAALERINHHEQGVLTVFPEAWEFAPRGRSAPAKDEAIAMARKGAVLGNYLLCDSQDIAGVDTVLRQATSVWILGVQRELNELKRTLDSIPAGIAKPKSADVATLELGQFFACWGRHVVKTYVQPAWMLEGLALRIATGQVDRADVVAHVQAFRVAGKEDGVTKEEAAQLRRENETLLRQNADLRQRVEQLERQLAKGQHDTGRTTVDHRRASPAREPGADRAAAHGETAARDRSAAPAGGEARPLSATTGQVDEGLYQAIKARLMQEAPTLLRVLAERPELEVHLERHVITAEGDTLRGRIARLIADDFFAQARTSADVRAELEKSGISPSNIELGNELKALTQLGFFTRENKWINAVPGMKVHVVEA